MFVVPNPPPKRGAELVAPKLGVAKVEVGAKLKLGALVVTDEPNPPKPRDGVAVAAGAKENEGATACCWGWGAPKPIIS